MQPLISIIIPTCNRSHLLGETLDSIIAQTYTNWECIVIDDGSTDHTQELMDFYIVSNPQITYFHRPNDMRKGANACRNFGLELSKGDYINWFDDDDIMLPEKLGKQIKSLDNSNNNFSVCQAMVFENNTNNIIGFRHPLIASEQAFKDYLKMKISWLTQAPLWKKDFLLRNKFKFDEELNAAQEWEFHLRILNKFPDYAVVNDALVLLRKHEFSITHNQNEKQRFWHYFQARLKIYRNMGLNLDPDTNQFLEEYLLNAFKKMIVTRNRNIFKAFELYVLPESKITIWSKINALLAILGYRLFNRGNSVLQKIKLK